MTTSGGRRGRPRKIKSDIYNMDFEDEK